MRLAQNGFEASKWYNVGSQLWISIAETTSHPTLKELLQWARSMHRESTIASVQRFLGAHAHRDVRLEVQPNQEFGDIGVADVCTPAHQELAVEAARQGIVLLKNDGNILPLSKNINTAVMGIL